MEHEYFGDPVATFQSAVQTLKRSEAKAAQERDARGYLFPLRHTGGQAHVRRMTMASLATMTGISPSMKAIILEVFQSNDEKGAALTWEDLQKNVARQDEMARGVCCAAFLSPRVTETEAQADEAGSEDVLYVGEIDQRDRNAFLQSVLQPESEAAALLAPFPEAGS